MKIDYLWSEDGRAHAINNFIDGGSMTTGIFCLVSCAKTTLRMINENHAVLIEVPPEFRSSHERVKVFNALLNVLDHEQIQLSRSN